MIIEHASCCIGADFNGSIEHSAKSDVVFDFAGQRSEIQKFLYFIVRIHSGSSRSVTSFNLREVYERTVVAAGTDSW